MVDVTKAPGDPESDESSLLCSKMNAALHGLAQVDSVTVDRVAGLVFAHVHLPDDLPEAERARHRVRVQAALTVVVAGAFAAAGLVLAPLDAA
jgi:hypothetical protein